MTSIDRTAYPHLNKQLNDKELAICYTLNESERDFIKLHARHIDGHLTLAVMLKTRQQLGYFVSVTKVPIPIITYLSKQLDISNTAMSKFIIKPHDKKTLYRYRTICRQFLGSTAFSKCDKQHFVTCVHKAAYTMSDPADLINVAVEITSVRLSI